MDTLLTQFMNKYAYTDFHELNADWLIRTTMELINQVENFVSLNAIKYADPIQWNITSQYEKNTVVIEPITGTAYLSITPVPSGVSIYNTEYWTEVFSLERFLNGANSNFTNHIDNNTLTATIATNNGEWVIWNDLLYVATSTITPGDAYVEGGNIARVTMNGVYVALLQDISTNYTKMINNDSTLAGNFAVRQEHDTTTSTYNINAGEWVVINYELYSALTNISVGDTYVIGSNIKKLTVEEIYVALLNAISSLNTTLDNRITSINNALSSRISLLEMNNIIIMGDSYAQGVTNGGQSPNVTSWAAHLRSLLGKTDDTSHIIGIASGAFAASNPSLNFTDVLTSQAQTIEAKFDPLTVSHIIICAGANEILYNYADAYNGVIAFCNYCAVTYPNAKVYIGMIGYGGQGIINGANTLLSYHDISLCSYVDGAETCANAVYLSGVENAHKKYYRGYHNGSDGVHPNAYGYLCLARAIKQALIEGQCDVRSIKEAVTITPVGQITITANRLYTIVDNDRTTFFANNQVIINGIEEDNYIASGTTPIEIGTVTSGAIIGRADNISWNMPAFYYDSSNALHAAHAQLYIDSNKLYIAIEENSASAWLLTSIRSIYLFPFNVTTITTMC